VSKPLAGFWKSLTSDEKSIFDAQRVTGISVISWEINAPQRSETVSWSKKWIAAYSTHASKTPEQGFLDSTNEAIDSNCL
jgi:hypothetical protein